MLQSGEVANSGLGDTTCHDVFWETARGGWGVAFS